MTTVPAWESAAVFALTTAITAVLTPMALRLAVRRAILDRPNAIKSQAQPVPYLGGMAVLVAFSVVLLALAAIHPAVRDLDELVLIVGLALLLGLLGLVDDLRTVSPVVRLAVEAGAAIVFWAMSDGSANMTGQPAVDLAITVVWIVAVVNAVNMLDNMDGLSAGVSAVAAGSIFAIARVNGQVLVATLAIALMGCALGFLRSNFPPARIYMGDAGALFIGFVLAALSLEMDVADAPRVVAWSVPVLVLGVPLFDAALVIVTRALHRRNPMTGGRDHTSHRLVAIGIAVPAAVTLIYIAAASLGLLAMVVSRVDEVTAVLLVGWVAAVGLGIGLLLGLVPVYETSRRRRLVLQEVARPAPGFRSIDSSELPTQS
jgi:UDP-GlcNAc:undecaprenyl-phosphate GlcNAc-1-phosphate transferase